MSLNHENNPVFVFTDLETHEIDIHEDYLSLLRVSPLLEAPSSKLWGLKGDIGKELIKSRPICRFHGFQGR